ncbi:hypothetical protein KC19_VG301200 [Ceratodon purpureus]|uniref:DNL-type domain-containing protein n=1 Tax=Ceratodon purpureus TaxID=3225 RepID=A0A8T0HW28_CERPU|nr:hypothetical protein KC19_VG301200 [Ceratodon purpureus]
MATRVVLQVGASCLAVSCPSSSGSQRCGSGSGAGVHQSFSQVPVVLKADSSGMKFRGGLGSVRSEDVKVLSPVVGVAPRRFDSFEEPSASDWETEERETSPQSLDKQDISPEAGAIVLSSSSSSSSSTSLQSLSRDAAMGIILSAAGSTGGWTTGSGLEGPAYSIDLAGSEMPGPIFCKSPRRRMRVAFTCNVCGHRSIRAINPRAYTDGTVFVQVTPCPSSLLLGYFFPFFLSYAVIIARKNLFVYSEVVGLQRMSSSVPHLTFYRKLIMLVPKSF